MPLTSKSSFSVGVSVKEKGFIKCKNSNRFYRNMIPCFMSTIFCSFFPWRGLLRIWQMCVRAFRLSLCCPVCVPVIQCEWLELKWIFNSDWLLLEDVSYTMFKQGLMPMMQCSGVLASGHSGGRYRRGAAWAGRGAGRTSIPFPPACLRLPRHSLLPAWELVPGPGSQANHSWFS